MVKIRYKLRYEITYSSQNFNWWKYILKCVVGQGYSGLILVYVSSQFTYGIFCSHWLQPHSCDFHWWPLVFTGDHWAWHVWPQLCQGSFFLSLLDVWRVFIMKAIGFCQWLFMHPWRGSYIAFFLSLKYLCVYVCLGGCVSVHRSQKRAPNPLETVVTDSYEPPCGCCDSNPDSSQCS